MADNVRNEGKFLPLFKQIAGGFENPVPKQVDIPRTGGRGSEYLRVPYEYFHVVLLPFGAYCCKLCPSNNPRRKNHKD
jgi:hypothetical protein